MNHHKIKILFSSVLHLLGIFTLFAIFAGFFVSKQTSILIFSLLDDSQISDQIVFPILILLGLSTATWGIGAFAFHSFGRTRTRTLTRTHGTVMTETLIVLPIFLLLTSGLAQLGINSMAGLLTTVGAFEAGRTIAVWGPEIGKERIEGKMIDIGIVKEQARIAVAAIVTPVARDGKMDTECTSSDAFSKFEQGMGAALNPTFGLSSKTDTDGAKTKIWSYSDAFGSQTFQKRGPPKLKSAYCSVSIAGNIENIPTEGKTGGDFTVEVTYTHQPVFAFVQRIFDNTEIKRKYTMHSHLPSNDTLPKSQ